MQNIFFYRWNKTVFFEICLQFQKTLWGHIWSYLWEKWLQFWYISKNIRYFLFKHWILRGLNTSTFFEKFTMYFISFNLHLNNVNHYKCQLKQQNWNRFAFPYLVKFFVINFCFYLCLCNCGCCVYLCKSFEVTKLFVWKIDMLSNLKTFQDHICISKQCLTYPRWLLNYEKDKTTL